MREKVEAAEFDNDKEKMSVTADQILKSPFWGKECECEVLKMAFAVIDSGCYSIKSAEHDCEPDTFIEHGIFEGTEHFNVNE